MNTIRTYPPRQALASCLLFLGLALTSPLLNAQTFRGRAYLAESPVSIQAFIYPDAHKMALKIRMENRTSNAVRVRIVNEARKTVYDDYIATPTYYGRFNLSALPYGTYTIELSNRTARLNQTFRIESATVGRIALVPNPPEQDSLLSINQKFPMPL